MVTLRRTALALVVLLSTSLAFAADTAKFDIKTNYTKHEYRIAMRDGVHLFTAVYVPKAKSKKYPFLISRTPYSVAPYGEGNYPPLRAVPEFWQAGYIIVMQDARGRYMSEGKFEEMRPHRTDPKATDESTDLYDTIEWLLKNVPNNNGRAGLWGISYGGFYTSSSMIDSHPALKACSPQAPMTDEFMGDDAYHGGAFMLSANFGFYHAYFHPQNNPMKPPANFEPQMVGNRNGYDYYLHDFPSLTEAEKKLFNPPNPYFNDQANHTVYDQYWIDHDMRRQLKDVRCSVLTVGGWFDAEDLFGPFGTYGAVEKQNPKITNTLVIGPWVHGGWAARDGRRIGNVEFDSKTAEFYRKNIALPFFEHLLKDAPDPALPEAYMFETGSNVWRKYPAWPPKEAKKAALYLLAAGKISFDAPSAEQGAQFDEYISDPDHPVPYVAYNVTPEEVPQEYMVSDQRFAATRPDVLVYRSEPLTEDVTFAGPVSPELFVSTSGTDSDYVVKLIDEYPHDLPEADERHGSKDVDVPPIDMAGYQMLVRGWPFRAKFRHGFEKPEAMTPNQVEEIRFNAPDINHTFRKGHRIMVQIQSSWFPLADRNPQTFVNIPDAKPSDYKKATERVYHTPQQASSVGVMVLK